MKGNATGTPGVLSLELVDEQDILHNFAQYL